MLPFGLKDAVQDRRAGAARPQLDLAGHHPPGRERGPHGPWQKETETDCQSFLLF